MPPSLSPSGDKFKVRTHPGERIMYRRFFVVPGILIGGCRLIATRLDTSRPVRRMGFRNARLGGIEIGGV